MDGEARRPRLNGTDLRSDDVRELVASDEKFYDGSRARKAGSGGG